MSKEREQRLEKVIQRLEDQVLQDSSGLHLRGETNDSPPTSVPAKVREIITKSLASDDGSSQQPSAVLAPEAEHLMEENRVLQLELNRIEKLLAATSTERDALRTKYNSISKRLDAALHGTRGDIEDSPDDFVTSAGHLVMQQNAELQSRLEDERLKVRSHMDAQRQQERIVQKLQAEVLQYKSRCLELEGNFPSARMNTDLTRMPDELPVDGFDASHDVFRLHQVEADYSMTMDTLLIRLQEEQHRNIALTHTMDLLRDQLDSLMTANRNLATDLEKQEAQCERLKGRAAEWAQEEQSFGDYFHENQARLLDVWNAVGAFRYQFDSLKSATQCDLSQLKSDFVQLSQNARSACLNLNTNVHKSEAQNALVLEREKMNRSTIEKQLLDKKNELVQLQSELNSQSVKLNDKVRELMTLNERMKSQLTEEERKGVRLKAQVTQLESKIESLNREFLSVNSSKPSASDFDGLISTLQRITDEALNDINNSSSRDVAAFDLHALRRNESRSPTRNSSRMASYSPVWGGHELSPVVESAFRTVQKALRERRMQIDELKAKISAVQDQAESQRRQVERMESEKRHLELSMAGLKEERSQLISSQHDLQHTIDQLRCSLEASVSENQRLEQLRQTLVSKMEEVNGANQHLHAANTELQRLRNQLEDEKDDLSRERDRQIKDKELSRQQTEEAVAKASRLKEELVNIKESHKKTVLDLEMLSHERDEIKKAFTRAELSKSELELDSNKFRSEASCLRDDVLKLRALNDGLSQDKAELNATIVQLEEETVSVSSHIATAEQEKNGLHDRMLRLEWEKMELETEKSGLQSAIQLSELTRARLEDEVQQINHIRTNLSKQLKAVTRQKTLLAEQLVIVEGDFEKQTDAIVCLTKDKEEMNMLHRELTAQIAASERESRHQNEMIASLNIEKEDLESSLYDIQQLQGQMEINKTQLEAERQELLLKNESLTVEVERLRRELHETAETSEQQREALRQRLIAVEKDNQCFQQDLRNEKDLHDDDVRRISQELEKVCAKLEAERDVMLGQFAHDRDSILADAKVEKEQLLRELSAIQHERDDLVVSAENRRKELLVQADHEQSSFQEKITLLERDLAFGDREKQELRGQIDRHLRTVESLQSEIRSVKASFGQTIEMREKESKSLNQQSNDLVRQRDSALNDVNELKMKLHLVEETRERLEHDLGQVNRKLQEADEAKDLLQKQIRNLKCNLSEETYEKQAIQKTSDDVLSLLKKTEAEKVELSRKIQDFKQKLNVLDGLKTGVEMEVTDLHTSLRELEKARQEARSDLHENRTRIKMLTADRDRLTRSLQDLQERLGKAELREENSQKEIHQLRQKLLDSEKDRESMQRDVAAVRCHLTNGENQAHLKDREFKLVVEDRERGVARAEDQRRLVEATLERSKADIEGNRVRLGAGEGKVLELENKLAEVEAENHDLEMKLAGVVSTLRRTIGYSPTTPGRSRNRSSSSPVNFSSADFDLESMRVAIHDHVDQATMVEHERDESVALLRSSQAHISNLEAENLRLLDHVEQLKKLLESVKEGKHEIDGQLNNTQSTLVIQSESLRRSERQQKHLSSRSDGLERAVAALEAEKRQLQEKLNKAKANEKRLAENRRTAAGHLGEAENHLTKAELLRRSLESEIQHLKMALNDKETENQVINNRAEHLVQQIENLEDKAQSLQTTIDRLSSILVHSSEERSNHKNHVQALLNFSLSDRSTTISGQERIALFLKTLASSEQDRRFLQEKLENVICSLKDAIRKNETLTERFRALEAELSDCNVHRAELETQLHQSHDMLLQRQDDEEQLNGKIQRLIIDKQSMQEIIATLQRNLAKLGAEKRKAEMSTAHLENDRNTLKKDLNKRNGVLTKVSMENLDWSLRHLEEENMKLLHEVQALQLQLTDAEQSHAKRLGELIARHRQESSLESDRLLSAKLQTEKLLEAREREHRQHIKTLEEQILTLKDELKHVIRMSRTVRGSHSSSEINGFRSLGTGPNFLDHETKKPNGIVENNRRSTSPGKTPGSQRSSPVRAFSPTRVVQTQSRGSSPTRSAVHRR